VIALPLIAAVLLLIVLGVVVLPLLRPERGLAARGEFDRAVYRDQLKELDRDVTRGLIADSEAQGARLEIQRRVLATATPPVAAPDAPPATQRRSPRLAIAVSLLVAAGAGGLYARLGSPTLHAAPPARPGVKMPEASGPAGHEDMKDAADRLAEKLKADPKNADGWLLYARTSSMMNEWDTATAAYRQAIALGQNGDEVYAGLGEMLVMAADGIVSPAARDAFAKSIAAQPKNDVARFYLALADAQAGEAQKAITAWVALAGEIPVDSPMRNEITRRVAEAAQTNGFAPPTLPSGLPSEAPEAGVGPTPEQMAQAADMPPDQRDKMIGGMIDQLAARLQTQPGDLDGWMRLGNAYAVQQQTAKSIDAYDHAIRLKPNDPDIKLTIVEALITPLQPSDPLPERAVALLREVAAVTPNTPEVLWYLGIVAARNGNTGEARSDWTRLLAALPSGSEDAKTVQAALAELK